MDKFAIIIGVVVLAVGFLGFPPIANLLPVSHNSLFGNSHTYYRIVATGQGSGYVPALLVATGLLLCGAGVTLRRRRNRR